MSDVTSKRRKVQQALLVETSCSKSGIARILRTLRDSGVLVEGALREPRVRSIRGDLTRSAAAVGQTMTPFWPPHEYDDSANSTDHAVGLHFADGFDLYVESTVDWLLCLDVGDNRGTAAERTVADSLVL